MEDSVKTKKKRVVNLKNEVLVGRGGPSPAGWHGVEQFLRCPKAYQLEMVRGITVPLARTPGALGFGTLFHAQRAAWFAAKFDTSQKTLNRISAALDEAVAEEKLPIHPKDVASAAALFGAYMEHWSKRARPTPLAVEHLIGPAPLREDMRHEKLFRTGKLDDLSKYPEAGGALCLGECKTSSSDVSGVIRQYELHGQQLLYSCIYRTCENGEARFGPSAGVVLDIAIKAYDGGKPKFARAFIEIRPHAADWFAESLRGYLAAMHRVEWDTPCPRNPTGCTFMAGRARVDCKFKELCRFGKSGAGRYIFQDGTSLRKHEPVKGKEAAPWD